MRRLYRVFIVEDDTGIREELTSLLTRYGYECVASVDFAQIVERILEAEPHIVLLDINLPQFDGYYVCRELRKHSSVPVVVVTSRDSQVDELMSMNMGADDFITKPYHPQILLARIASVLKRSYHQPSTLATLEYKGLILDLSASTVSYQDQSVELTKNECKILQIFMRSPGEIISRSQIMDSLWQSDEFIDDNTLTVNINRLRKKLESVGVMDFLKTRRGQGYQI